jgi:hypoxanthine phosphoribosyltransferase
LTRCQSPATPRDVASLTDETRSRVMISADRIAKRVAELGAAITEEYRDKNLVLVCVLRGSFMFAADLARAISLPLKIEFLGVQSYGEDTESSGVVRITLDLKTPIADEHVLVVEDIVDTGLTLNYLLEHLRVQNPASVRVCSLLHKPARTRVEVPIDYLGFTIDDVFVVGYGLDIAHFHRNLPYVAELRPVKASAEQTETTDDNE